MATAHLVCLLLLRGAVAAPDGIEALSAQLTTRLVASSLEAPVGVFVEGDDATLARALASVLAARLSSSRLPARVIEAPSAREARTLAEKDDLRALVRLSLTVRGGTLSVRGDASSLWVNFWSGKNSPVAQAVSLSATTGVGADVAPVATALRLSISSLGHFAKPISALATGDLDGDKHAEVLVLFDDALSVLAADGRMISRFETSVLPFSKTPGRENFGAISFINGRVDLLDCKKQQGARLTWSLGVFKQAAPISELQLDSSSVRCVPGAALLKVDSGPEVVARSGRGALHLSVLSNATAQLSAPTGTVMISGVGAAAVLNDFDGDGQLELAFSSAAAFPENEVLTVVSLTDAQSAAARKAPVSEAKTLWQAPIGKVRALVSTTGDLDGDGLDEWLVGTWLADGTSELLLVRREP